MSKPQFVVIMSNREFTHGIISQPQEPMYEYDKLAHIGYYDANLLLKFFQSCKGLVEKGGKVEIGIMTRDTGSVSLVARPALIPKYAGKKVMGFSMVAPWDASKAHEMYQRFPDGYIIAKEGEDAIT